MLHSTLIWSGPRVPSELSATFSPRDAVWAVAYSQLSPEPVPGASSLHCCRGGCALSIAQKAVTAMLAVSLSPTRLPAACALCRSAYVHTCVESPKLVWHAARAPGSPSAPLKLKRPRVAVSAPLRTDPPDGVVVCPAHVPSVAQASNLLKRPSVGPQALPLHPLADGTIDAFTRLCLFSAQHTAPFGLPQIEAFSHFMISLRHGAAMSAAFKPFLTHCVYFPCVWSLCVQPQVFWSICRAFSMA